MARPAATLALVLGLPLAGCLTSAAEMDSLQSAWGDCVMSAVMRMDDGKTDPVSLAYGLAPQCAVQYQRFSAAQVSSSFTEGGQAAQRQLWREKEVQMITSAILIYRSKGKKT